MLPFNHILHKIKWLVALLLYCYIIYKAVSIEITQDEAYSYFLVKTNHIKAMAGTANTHWLNSLVMKLFLGLPGYDSLWKIRMLSLLSWPVYCYSTIQLSSLFKNKWLALVFFAVAVLNPFLVFYFSLARGYASTCAFIMLALWQAARVLQGHEIEPEKWFSVFVFAALAVMANFSSFYFFMALTIVYGSYLLFNKSFTLLLKKPAQKLNILVAGLSLFAISALLVIKYYGRDLEFGTTSDLIGSLFGSLVANSRNIVASAGKFYTAGEYDVAHVYSSYGLIVFGFAAGALIYAICYGILYRKVTIGSFTAYILFTVVLLCMLFGIFFKTPYLADRNSLVLYPLVTVSVFCLADTALPHIKMITAIVNGSAAALLLLCGYNFYKSYNTRYFNEWSIQSDTKEGLAYLRNANAGYVGMDLWHYSVYTNYYSIAFPGQYRFNTGVIGIKEMLTATDPARFSKFDYLLLSPPYNGNNTVLKNWKTIVYFKDSGAKILVRK